MGSPGKKNRQRERHEFTRPGTSTPAPPGGWPAAGSGYEPDPFSPVGSWVQMSKIIGATGARRRWIAIPFVVIVLVFLVLSMLPR